MTFDHEFCYFFLLFSSLLKKEGREKENEEAKIVIKSNTFLFHLFLLKIIYIAKQPHSVFTVILTTYPISNKKIFYNNEND